MKKILLIAALLASGISFPAHAVCINPSGPAGMQMYNATHNVMQYCNGTSWISMDGSFTGMPGPVADGLGTAGATQNLNMGGFKVQELGTPTANTDAATKAYIDSKVGSGETDPQVGAVTNNNWCKGTGTQASCASAAPTASTLKMMVVADEKADGTNGGTPATYTWTNRDLNTIRFNNLGGSLASNTITLPAGVYYIDVLSTFMMTVALQMRIVNTTGDVLLYGGSGFAGSVTTEANSTMHSYLRGVIGLTAQTGINLQYRLASAAAGNVVLGRSVAGFGNEVYTVMQISKIAAPAVVAPPTPPCAGTRLNYRCWYLGGLNQNCDTVCAARGGCALNSIRDHAGSAGTNANCLAVLTALGVPGAVSDSTATTNNYEFLGCNVRAGTSYRYTAAATTCSDAYSTSQRACACAF